MKPTDRPGSGGGDPGPWCMTCASRPCVCKPASMYLKRQREQTTAPAREWWIHPSENEIWEREENAPLGSVHVIEFSHYESACKERDEYKAMCKDSEPLFSQRLVPQLEGRIKLLTHENGALKGELEATDACANRWQTAYGEAAGEVERLKVIMRENLEAAVRVETARLRSALERIICNGPMSVEEHSKRADDIARAALAPQTGELPAFTVAGNPADSHCGSSSDE